MTQVVEVRTSVGPGRWHLDVPRGRSRMLLALGHGAGGGVEAADLRLLAAHLPAWGVAVARFEQPWRLAGRPVAVAPPRLDTAWCEALPALPAGLPLICGGRSAGARVACRTADAAGAVGVLALAFPLHPPGRPERSRASELVADRPLLAVQGTRDPFGSDTELEEALAGRPRAAVTGIPGADHGLRVARTGPLTQGEADELLLLAVRRWAQTLVRGATAVGNQPGRRGR